MRKLQNNFTTPEQSKRLLELGVPADSADLYTSLGFENLIWIRNTKNELSEDFFDALINGKSAHIPIWSVGRLIEICKICSNVPIDWTGGLNEEREILEVVYSTLFALCLGKHMDFSKLEE